MRRHRGKRTATPHKGRRVADTATNPKVVRAAKEFSFRLREAGIRHALVGGLAVAAHGYPRATADVDFLISSEHAADLAGDALGGEVSGKTVRFKGVDIDLIFPNESFLEREIPRTPPNRRGVPTISIEVLVCMKLMAARARDQGDVVELIKRGRAPAAKVVAYLKEHRPDLVDDFAALQMQAEVEAD